MDAADTSDSVAGDALAWITTSVLDGHDRGDLSAAATLFLMRRYVTRGGSDLRTAVETGLTRGVEAAADERDPRERCQWLGVFAEASSMSEDDSRPEAVNRSLAPTIDDLEQLIRAAYEPGDGLLDASLQDQLRTAVALLTAFELTGRLPYSMLAEELLQVARRTSWDDARGMLRSGVVENSLAVQVMCRLAVLHRDPSYIDHAVVAESPSYEADASRALETLATTYRDDPAAAAAYGLALLEWFALSTPPN